MINQALISRENLILRPASERGHVDLGWLRSAHSFSFGSYVDREHVQFESLRVINDDYIIAGEGFPEHPHQNAEIFSYILDGSLAHKDSMGNGSTVSAGGIQYMSAGAGVRHSEFNPSDTEETRLLQIWLLPSELGGEPRYETMDLTPQDKDGKLKLFLSKDGRDGSISMKAKADVYAATLNGGQSFSFEVNEGKKAWVQVARGQLGVNGKKLKEGDGLAVTVGGRLDFSEGRDAEIILFDFHSD